MIDKTVRILFVGDIVGRPGRRVLFRTLDDLRIRYELDLVVVNAENAAGGFGVTKSISDEFFDHGVDVLTSGNHIWDKREVFDFISDEPRLLRPHNYPASAPGHGWIVVTTPSGCNVGILNLMGTVFMHPTLDCPFRCADEVLKRRPDALKAVIVDFHAEATSEKQAMGHYLDGRVSAVLGSHIHVPTADERVLAHGTAYISDVGMTGCYDSVIGMETRDSVRRFVERLPQRLEVATGKATLCGVVVDVDSATGRGSNIERVSVSE